LKRLTERAKKLVQQLATEKDIRISSEKLLQQAKKELQKKEAENVEQRLIIQQLQRYAKKKNLQKNSRINLSLQPNSRSPIESRIRRPT